MQERGRACLFLSESTCTPNRLNFVYFEGSFVGQVSYNAELPKVGPITHGDIDEYFYIRLYSNESGQDSKTVTVARFYSVSLCLSSRIVGETDGMHADEDLGINGKSMDSYPHLVLNWIENLASNLTDSIQHGGLPATTGSAAPSLLETGKAFTAKGMQVLEQVGRETMDLLISETGIQVEKNSDGIIDEDTFFEEITFDRFFYIYGGPGQLEMIWPHSFDGFITSKAAYDHLRSPFPLSEAPGFGLLLFRA
ncbi:hypothetical protein DH2020_018952 [Rehmannia glutinosa]|uniref:Uncharacterized protein n=1 Tax=Rehmannia glutinosa TaxID=99300 RepID=A0ABR0WLK5_REHGL